MLEKLRLVEERYMEMEERAAQPDFYADPKAATKLLNRSSSNRSSKPIAHTRPPSRRWPRRAS